MARKQAKPKPESREDIIAAFSLGLDEGDKMLREDRFPHGFDTRYASLPKPRKLLDKLDGLRRQLEAIENPEGEYDKPGAEEALMAALTAHGEVPSLARPGSFLLWIGRIPVLCTWAGLVAQSSVAVAIEADGLFPWADGYLDFYVRTVNQHETVDTMFRRMIAARLGNATSLEQLNDDAREKATLTRQAPENAWLAAALAKGPVEAVPLPPHLRTVQRRLFA